MAILPTLRAVVGDDAKQDFRLERVSILEFIDEDMPIMLPERFTYSLVLGDECASALQKIIEVERTAAARLKAA